MSYSPQERTENDVNTLYAWVTELNCSFFEDYSEAVVKDLCKCMAYESIPDSTVCKSIFFFKILNLTFGTLVLAVFCHLIIY